MKNCDELKYHLSSQIVFWYDYLGLSSPYPAFQFIIYIKSINTFSMSLDIWLDKIVSHTLKIDSIAIVLIKNISRSRAIRNYLNITLVSYPKFK